MGSWRKVRLSSLPSQPIFPTGWIITVIFLSEFFSQVSVLPWAPDFGVSISTSITIASLCSVGKRSQSKLQVGKWPNGKDKKKTRKDKKKLKLKHVTRLIKTDQRVGPDNLGWTEWSLKVPSDANHSMTLLQKLINLFTLKKQELERKNITVTSTVQKQEDI